MSQIHTLTMPKWGLSMTEGRVNAWLKNVGDTITKGDDVLDVETDKISSSVEAPFSGVLRRCLAQEDETLPVGALLAVVVEGEASEEEIDTVVESFLADFVPGDGEAEETGPQPRKVPIGDYQIRYLERGEGGTPLVLIHGFSGDLNNWLFNHEMLAAKRWVIALDLPGHGESSKTLQSAELQELSSAVLALLDHLGVSRAHFAGHSMGGAVALEIAQQAPQSVASLTLIGSAGLGEEINGSYIQGFVEANSRNQLKPQVVQLFSNAELVTRQLLEDLLKYKRLEGVEVALKRLADNLFPNGKQASLYRDTLTPDRPTLVIWGSDDAIIPAKHAQGLPDHVRVEIIAGQGHMVQMEAADRVNSLIEQFIDGSA